MAMQAERILVVDDEQNIRLTLTHTLETEGYQIETALNGEDALQQLQQAEFDLILLDLRMPGMDGMEVLRQVVKRYPQIKVVVLTAHGTIDSAVEAMKIGAADFIQKPFAPQEIRDLVANVLNRTQREATQAANYAMYIELARGSITADHLSAALEQVKRALVEDATRPEAFNLLGVVYDLYHDHHTAMQNYRIALDLDPTYAPARNNLSRPSSAPASRSSFDLGSDLGLEQEE